MTRFRRAEGKGLRRYDDRVRSRSQRSVAAHQISEFVGDRAAVADVEPSVERCQYTERCPGH